MDNCYDGYMVKRSRKKFFFLRGLTTKRGGGWRYAPDHKNLFFIFFPINNNTYFTRFYDPGKLCCQLAKTQFCFAIFGKTYGPFSPFLDILRLNKVKAFRTTDYLCVASLKTTKYFVSRRR